MAFTFHFTGSFVDRVLPTDLTPAQTTLERHEFGLLIVPSGRNVHDSRALLALHVQCHEAKMHHEKIRLFP